MPFEDKRSTIHIVTQMEAGGSQGAAIRMAEAFRGLGIPSHAVFLYVKRPVYEKDDTVHALLDSKPKSILQYVRLFFELVKYLRSRSPSAVFTYGRFANPFGLLAAWIAGVPTRIASQRSLPSSYPIMLRAADSVLGTLGVYSANIAVSHTTAAAFANYPPRYRSRMRVIPNGIPTRKAGLSKQEARRFFGVPADVPLIVSVGRLAPVKNHQVLVRALQSIEGVHLAIAGDGESRIMLQELGEEVGTSQRIHLVGELAGDRIPDFLAMGDVFAFPSLHESFGFALVEALQAGLPVICSDIGAFREILTLGGVESPAGILVDPENPDAWVNALRQVISDAPLRLLLVGEGRKRAEKYTLRGMVGGYLDCLHRR